MKLKEFEAWLQEIKEKYKLSGNEECGIDVYECFCIEYKKDDTVAIVMDIDDKDIIERKGLV